MAEQLRRNAGGSQPISQHPLFPAIVALWFGALFGLGSIVIQPAVIEHAVVAIGLDRIVPMAAPPLGTTTRILIALAMTGLGGVLGALIARRVARPAPEAHERRRGAVAMGANASFADDDLAAADATTEITAAPARSAPSARARTPMAPGRRRSLTMLEPASTLDDAAETTIVPDRPASILNVAEFDLDGFEQGDAADFRDGGFGARRDAGIAARIEEDVPVVGAAQARYEAWDDDGHHPSDECADNAAPPARSNRLFESYSRQITARSPASGPALAPIATPEPALTTAPPEPGFTLMPRFNVADWSNDQGHANAGNQNEREDDQGEDGTYALAPALARAPAGASPLFDRPAPSEYAIAPSFAPEAPAFAAGASSEDDDREPAYDQTPAHDAGAPAAPKPSAAGRLVAAQLDDLSPVELLERLALAMAQRRKDARLAAAVPVAAPVAPLAASSVLASLAGLRATPEADAGDAGLASSPAPAVEAPASVVRALGFEPLAFRPAGLDETPAGNVWEPEVEAEPAVEAPLFAAAATEPAPTPVMSGHIPAALRPVSFEAYADDEDDDALPGYLPPRHIGMAQGSDGHMGGADAEAGDFDVDFDDAGFDDDARPGDEDGEETLVLEQGYSSLLDLSRPVATRQPFVRIDEPEETGEIQPVVIFPGEETREPGPFARPVPVSTLAPVSNQAGQGLQASALPPFPPTPFAPASFAPAASPFTGERMFDAPGRSDPAETERALRAALATLQRMSGTA